MCSCKFKIDPSQINGGNSNTAMEPTEDVINVEDANSLDNEEIVESEPELSITTSNGACNQECIQECEYVKAFLDQAHYNFCMKNRCGCSQDSISGTDSEIKTSIDEEPSAKKSNRNFKPMKISDFLNEAYERLSLKIRRH